MANLKSAQSSSRIVVKLDKLIEEENYYEAHQLYRTIYFRYLNAKRFQELESLFLKGSLVFLEKGQANSGADLASLYIDAIIQNPDTEKNFENVALKEEFANNVAKFFSLIPQGTPERISMVVKFSKLGSVFPVAQIHSLVARQLWKEDNYKDARTHFLHSASFGGTWAAEMLISYQLKSNGPDDEVHLLLVQFLLQLLCLTKKAEPPTIVENKTADKKIDLSSIKPRSPEHQFAITTFIYYTENHPKIDSKSDSFSAPLLNFLAFLLLSLESGIYDTYRVLLDVYRNELDKDGEFEKYLTKLGEIYFNVRPRQTGGFLGNLLQQFLQESDEEEESASTSQQPTQQPTQQNQPSAPQQQPAAMPFFPPFSLFEQMCQPPRPTGSRQPSSQSNRNNTTNNLQSDDLD